MAGLERRDRCLEGFGPESLPDVVETLLNDRETRQYDVGIVRGLLDDTGVQALQDAFSIATFDSGRDASTDTSERMERALHDSTGDALADVNHTVTTFWKRNGINPQLRLDVSPRLHFDRCIMKSSRTHLDTIPYKFDNKAQSSLPLNGPITLSVRMDTSPQTRLFYARRLPAQHTPTLKRQIHDVSTYEQLSRRIARWHSLRGLFCTVVEQSAGDAVVLPAHPWPSVHSTKHGEMSWAALYDYRLTRPK